jgi:hypothetical protein
MGSGRQIVAAAGDQPYAHGIAPGHEPIAVVLDLVKPVGAGRWLVGWRWEAGSMTLARSAAARLRNRTQGPRSVAEGHLGKGPGTGSQGLPRGLSP